MDGNAIDTQCHADGPDQEADRQCAVKILAKGVHYLKLSISVADPRGGRTGSRQRGESLADLAIVGDQPFSQLQRIWLPGQSRAHSMGIVRATFNRV